MALDKTSATPEIEVENLIIRYGPVAAVGPVTFAVKQGEQLTLLGPSGCGKTTTLRSIAGLEIADRSPTYPWNYLLDGQQRLSTVCGVLYWTPDNKGSVWNVAPMLRSESKSCAQAKRLRRVRMCAKRSAAGANSGAIS